MRLLLKPFLLFSSASMLLSCQENENVVDVKIPKNIKSKINLAHTVKYGDPFPIALDVNEDGIVDYSLFVELTATSSGDHLYVGINPIGGNQIISTPEDDNRFLNMGFVLKKDENNVIHQVVPDGYVWTNNFSTLVIRHTATGQPNWHEGGWDNNEMNYAPIRVLQNNVYLYGWIGINFDKDTEILAVSSFAYNQTPDQEILAGEK